MTELANAILYECLYWEKCTRMRAYNFRVPSREEYAPWLVDVAADRRRRYGPLAKLERDAAYGEIAT